MDDYKSNYGGFYRHLDIFTSSKGESTSNSKKYSISIIFKTLKQHAFITEMQLAAIRNIITARVVITISQVILRQQIQQRRTILDFIQVRIMKLLQVVEL